MRQTTYNTVGKRLLIEFLARNAERTFTVDELFEALTESGASIGKSSLYRLLEKLVTDGAVRKFKESEKSAEFQYLGDEECYHHLHLKCESCGKLVHLKCRRSSRLLAHIFTEHGFSIDSKKSVLYGKCEDCQKNGV